VGIDAYLLPMISEQGLSTIPDWEAGWYQCQPAGPISEAAIHGGLMIPHIVVHSCITSKERAGFINRSHL
jgi:hypothetical protein